MASDLASAALRARPAQKHLLLIALTFSLLAPAAPCAGEPVRLDALIDEALASSLELEAIRERMKAREALARAEGALDDPMLKVEMMDLRSESPLSLAPGSAMLTRYTVSQTFPFPGKLPLKERIALKEARAIKSELIARELEIENEVKDAYHELAFLVESIRIYAEIREILTLMASIAEARYSTGQASQQDAIKANLEMTMLTNELIELEAQKGVQAARLNSLLYRPQGSPLADPASLPARRVRFSTDEMIEAAALRNPEIRALEAEAEATELSVELAGKNYYPDLMVGVAPVQRDGRFDTFDLMFQINIPLWRGKYDSLARTASANARALRARVLAERNAKGFEVKGAAIRVEAAERAMTLYDTSLVPQVRLSFESALKNYQLGRLDFLSLLDAERELKRTRLERLRAVLEYRKRVAYLERTVGEDLRPGGPTGSGE